jgi:hypothetical protein
MCFDEAPRLTPRGDLPTLSCRAQAVHPSLRSERHPYGEEGPPRFARGDNKKGMTIKKDSGKTKGATPHFVRGDKMGGSGWHKSHIFNLGNRIKPCS